MRASYPSQGAASSRGLRFVMRRFGAAGQGALAPPLACGHSPPEGIWAKRNGEIEEKTPSFGLLLPWPKYPRGVRGADSPPSPPAKSTGISPCIPAREVKQGTAKRSLLWRLPWRFARP